MILLNNSKTSCHVQRGIVFFVHSHVVKKNAATSIGDMLLLISNQKKYV